MICAVPRSNSKYSPGVPALNSCKRSFAVFKSSPASSQINLPSLFLLKRSSEDRMNSPLDFLSLRLRLMVSGLPEKHIQTKPPVLPSETRRIDSHPLSLLRVGDHASSAMAGVVSNSRESRTKSATSPKSRLEFRMSLRKALTIAEGLVEIGFLKARFELVNLSFLVPHLLSIGADHRQNRGSKIPARISNYFHRRQTCTYLQGNHWKLNQPCRLLLLSNDSARLVIDPLW
jgi:hypothetical protein